MPWDERVEGSLLREVAYASELTQPETVRVVRLRSCSVCAIR